jgi:hypothetical protein
MKLSILRLFHCGKIFFIDGKKIPVALAGDNAAGIFCGSSGGYPDDIITGYLTAGKTERGRSLWFSGY